VLYSLAHELARKLVELRKGDERRPIIFIGHSLGGLIIKRALIWAAESPQDLNARSLELSTVGLANFGTPDNDMPPESLAEMMNKIFLLSGKPDPAGYAPEITLQRDSEWILRELESFKPIQSEVSILSLSETKQTSFFGRGTFVRPVPN
jgi:hypothetical protein